LSADDLRKLRGVECVLRGPARCRWRRCGGFLANQIDCRFQLAREIVRRPVTVDVHVEHPRLIPEKMIVERGDVDAVLEQR
jgi:hypothetical protein